MREEELHRILSEEQKIVPSSGFVVSVMDAVRREAAAPPPIAFPWKRAMPGLFSAALALAWVVVVGVKLFSGGSAPEPPPAKMAIAFTLVAEAWKANGASWIVLALILSFGSVKLSVRLASGKT
jgi:hypothetical protein